MLHNYAESINGMYSHFVRKLNIVSDCNEYSTDGYVERRFVEDNDMRDDSCNNATIQLLNAAKCVGAIATDITENPRRIMDVANSRWTT